MDVRLRSFVDDLFLMEYSKRISFPYVTGCVRHSKGGSDLSEGIKASLTHLRSLLQTHLFAAFDRTWRLLPALGIDFKDKFVLQFVYWETRIHIMHHKLHRFPPMMFLMLCYLHVEAATFYTDHRGCAYFTYHPPTHLAELIKCYLKRALRSRRDWESLLKDCTISYLQGESVQLTFEWIQCMIVSAPSVCQPDIHYMCYVNANTETGWLNSTLRAKLERYAKEPNDTKVCLYHRWTYMKRSVRESLEGSSGVDRKTHSGKLTSVVMKTHSEAITAGDVNAKSNVPQFLPVVSAPDLNTVSGQASPVCNMCHDHCLRYLISFFTGSIGV